MKKRLSRLAITLLIILAMPVLQVYANEAWDGSEDVRQDDDLDREEDESEGGDDGVTIDEYNAGEAAAPNFDQSGIYDPYAEPYQGEEQDQQEGFDESLDEKPYGESYEENEEELYDEEDAEELDDTYNDEESDDLY